MNKELLTKTIENIETFWEWTKKNDKENLEKFPRVLFFAGEEYNRELAQNQELQEKTVLTIDFDQAKKEDMKKVEAEIEKSHDKLCFIQMRNINKITDPSLEKILLPYFDPSQKGAGVVFVVTSSTSDMGKLSTPLTSRLDCINVETAQPKQFFLDKYFNWILAGSVLLIFVFGGIIFWPSKKKEEKEKVK